MISDTTLIVLLIVIVSWLVFVLRFLLKISSTLDEIVAETKNDIRIQIISGSTAKFRVTASEPRVIEIQNDEH